MMDVVPLHIFCKQVALNSYYRLYEVISSGWKGNYKNKTYSTSHLLYWGGIKDEVGIEYDQLDICDVGVGYKEYKVETNFKNTKTLIESELNFYTDGSKLDDKVGAGFVVVKKGNVEFKDNVRLPNECSVFQAEIVAIKEAAAYLRKCESIKFVRFFVDSQAALLALNAGRV